MKLFDKSNIKYKFNICSKKIVNKLFNLYNFEERYYIVV